MEFYLPLNILKKKQQLILQFENIKWSDKQLWKEWLIGSEIINGFPLSLESFGGIFGDKF